MDFIWLVLVLLDGVRSAEPPTISGKMPLMTSSESSEALRVATVGLFSMIFFLKASIELSKLPGRSPAKRRLNSAFLPASVASRRASQS
ncbi:hypothetical protein D3C86_1897560 [compost metagenome]